VAAVIAHHSRFRSVWGWREGGACAHPLDAVRAVRRRRLGPRGAPGAARAEARFAQREVRGYEAEHVHGLWHLDFHHGSAPTRASRGRRVSGRVGTATSPAAGTVQDVPGEHPSEQRRSP
jgi:hypothetical protein